MRAWMLLALLGVAGAAVADGFSVAPLRVELGKNRSASLTVTNGDEAKTFEVRVMRWSQKNRDDSYAPSDELLAAPATFKADKGGTQVVRIALNRKLDGDEHAYRIFVEEVPAAKEVAPNSLKTVVSMAIPAFVAPQSGPITKAQATLKATLGKERMLQIELANPSKANLKLLEWQVSAAKGEPLLKVPSAAYVLAGNTLSASYRLPLDTTSPLKLTLRTDRGTFSTPIVR